MSARGVRVGRGIAAASVATLLAALSHTIGGGAVPLGAGTAIAFAFASLVCVALAGRRLSLVRLSIAVALSQLAYHALFLVSGSSGSLVARGHHGVSVTAGAMTDAAMRHDGGVMILAHVAAAVLTIAALHRGESVVRAVAALAARTVRIVFGIVTTPVPVRIAEAAASVAPPHLREATVVLSSMRHRGPPAFVLA